MCDAFVFLREFTLDFEEQARQRVCIRCHIVEGFFGQLHNLPEVTEQCLGLENIGVLVEARVGAFVLVVLIVDLTYNLLDDVLHRYEAAGAAEFIYDNGNMYFLRLKVAQQVVDHLRLWHEGGRSDKCLPAEVGSLSQMG